MRDCFVYIVIGSLFAGLIVFGIMHDGLSRKDAKKATEPVVKTMVVGKLESWLENDFSPKLPKLPTTSGDLSDIHLLYLSSEPRNITFHSPDGKQAVIDFSGDTVMYSGNMPVEDAAKIFFDCVFNKYKHTFEREK
ncbi:hypothetical protein LCGC14_2082530 [marine sediment metagenome]|uniref:Uncharacterized protein n=1 Tax=marine sediment metagenome TaxID=412755 RepID=A0A0F9GTG4_9ZZZZ